MFFKALCNHPFALRPKGRLVTKTVLVMQLTGIILLAAVLQVSARGNAQTVTYSTRATSLPNVFAAIERQTGYVFFYDKQDLQTATPVTVKLQDAPLQEAMEMILRGEPLGFAIRGNTIFITLKAPAATQPEAPAPSPNQDISGKILNEKGEPAEGVSISIKGSTIGVQTDAKGEFTLHDVPASAIIVVSHVGYEVQEIKVKDRRDFFIKLKVSAQTLADMRVTVSNGIFSLPRERATGSYDYIGPELINRSVSTNILDRLNGVASGVLFDNTAGNSINMQIRGMSTIQSNTQPLIVLNGMAFDGDLSTINPNDVESITILKDAAAASIWGVRAGNGVVVITTKKGRYNQPLRIDINSNVTTSSRPNLFYNPNFLDANDFINVEQQLYANGYYASQLTDPSEPPISPVVSLLDSANKGLVSQSYANNQINSYRNLDVRNDEKKYFYRPQVLQQYSASLTGGNDKANFLLSAGWDKNLASQVGNDYSRITINSMNTFSPIKGLELTAGLTYVQSSTNQDNTLSQLSTGGSYGLEGILPYGMLADSKGNPLPLLTGYNTNFVNQVAPSLGFLNWQFYPLEELRNHYNTTNTTESDIRAIAGLRYHIFSGLSVEGKYQYERAPTAGIQDQTQQSYATRNLINLYSNQDGNGNVIGYNIPVGDILGYNYNTLESQNFRAQLDFDKKWDNNILTIVVGYEARELTNSYNTYNVYGYSPSSSTSQTVDYVDAFYNNYGGGNIPSGITNGETINRYRSYFGNAGYTYKSKYTLSASGRIDQSNLFGVATNQKTVPLYSAGFKWDIDKEAFFNLSWLNTLKARLTYGYSGNTNNSIYAYPTALYLSGSSPYGSYTQAALSSPGDPDLRWERSAMVNAGIDFGLFKNVFSGSLDYYARSKHSIWSVFVRLG
jgi:TonB-linked SusC/RagA family outer membrane protein